MAIKGVVRPEYNFGHHNFASLAIRSNGKPASSLSAKRLQKREFVLEAELPPGYSPGFSLTLPGQFNARTTTTGGVSQAPRPPPELLCHLTSPENRDQYHVARANPLCTRGDERLPDSDSLQETSEWSDGEDCDGCAAAADAGWGNRRDELDTRIEDFLVEAAQLAHTQNTVQDKAAKKAGRPNLLLTTNNSSTFKSFAA